MALRTRLWWTRSGTILMNPKRWRKAKNLINSALRSKVRHSSLSRSTNEHLQAGLSFRQAARVMMDTKERTGLAATGSRSDYTIVKYACHICKICLQNVSELLESVWTFSNTLLISTHMCTTYLYICIRLNLSHACIISSHLLALSVFRRYIGLMMFEVASKAADTPCAAWRDFINWISFNGKKENERSF